MEKMYVDFGRGIFENCTNNVTNDKPPYADKYELPEGKLVEIIADDGFIWDKNKTYNYYWDWSKRKFNISEDGKKLIQNENDWRSRTTIVLKYFYSPEVDPNYTKGSLEVFDLVNCRCNYSTGEEISRYEDLEVRSFDGFIFPNIDIPLKVDGISKNFKKLNDTTLYYPASELLNKNVIVSNITAIEKPKTYGILEYSGKFINCTCNYTNGETLSPLKPISIVADEGYKFDDSRKYFINYNFGSYALTLSEDKKTLSYDVNSIGEDTDATIEGVTAVESPIVIEYQNISITGSFENCTCNYVDGEKLDPQKQIVIIAKKGFDFKGLNFHLDTNLGLDKFEKSDDDKMLFYSLKYLKPNSTISLFDKYYAIEEVVSVTPFINVYNPSDLEMKQLTKERFQNQGITDLFRFVTNLYICPFKLPEDIKNPSQNIVLGTVGTSVSSSVINNYKFEIDLGVIRVEEKYNNAIDYLNTEIYLYIPFVDPIELKPYDVIGKDLSCKYVYNLYSGKATILVYSGAYVIETLERDMLTYYPYILKENGDYNTNVLDFKMESMYVKIIRGSNPLLSPVASTCEHGQLKDYKGLVSCLDIIHLVDFNGTNEEREMLIYKMKEGVIIE